MAWSSCWNFKISTLSKILFSFDLRKHVLRKNVVLNLYLLKCNHLLRLFTLKGEAALSFQFLHHLSELMTEVRMKKETAIDWGLFIYLHIQSHRFVSKCICMAVLTFGPHVNVTNRSKDRKFCNFFRRPKSNNDIESRQLITPLPNTTSSCLFLDFGVELVYVDVLPLVPPAIFSQSCGTCKH